MSPSSSAGPRERLEILWYVIAIAGMVLGARLVQMQLVQAGEWRLAAERNRSQMIHQNAPRGRIYDRNGVPVATNAPAFSLIFLPSNARSRSDLKPLANELARQLGRDPDDLFQALEQAAREKSAIRLAENLPTQTMFRLSELKTIYPGVDLIVEARRYYPFGRFASHILGYMGKMSQSEWRERKLKGYRVDSRTGKLGLEKIFEDELRGHDGGLRMEVDAQGRLKRVLDKIPWEAGSNIHLTIDAAVQRAADEGLRATATGRGAAVAVDPRNGNVGSYPPGSTFKPIAGLAALSEGRVKPDDAVWCPGYMELGGRNFLCWEHKGHKRISWLMGLAQSCDVYFYTLGLKTGGATIERYARAFGLGSKTNIPRLPETRGHLFGPDTRKKMAKGWYDGDTLNLAIGQGELTVTPLQMAVVAAAFANRGSVWRPHYTQKIVYADGSPDYVQKPERLSVVPAKDDAWDEVQRGLEVVVASGTGVGARIPGLLVAGKTGTAQNPHGDDHAWFIAYAARPGEPSSIAVAVLVENGGHGGTTSAPVAKKMILAHFGMTDPYARPAPAPAAVPTGLPLPIHTGRVPL
ncbi:MAG: hypothetical protein HYZ74_04835 [Elusimicrobia bacterium]|nr:hypothetical protein [Elusimicrobiota bacterium]